MECENNVYLKKGATCATGVKWKGPGGSSFSFFTTWAAYFSLLSFFLLIYVKLNKSKNTFLIAIIKSSAACSLAVFAVAQLLLAFNPSIDEPEGTTYLITDDFSNKINKINLIWHQLPLVCVYLIMTYNFGVKISAVHIAAPALILLLIWMLVPVPVSKGSETKTTPFDKIKVVYNNPNAGILVAGVVVFASTVLVQAR